MTTFLPYMDFHRSAQCLDRHRLGKQRLDAFDLLIINSRIKPEFMTDLQFDYLVKRYGNHPAGKMWKPYLWKLYDYAFAVCLEWERSGHKGKTLNRLMNYWRKVFKLIEVSAHFPAWLNDDFCLTHQSNLIRKNPSHYRPIFGDNIPDNLPYIWPSKV